MRALDALELREVPDEARCCELLLALGGAQARAGDTVSARETFRKAAEPARRMGLPEQLARAALGFGYIGPELRHSGPASTGQGGMDDLAKGPINEELVPFLEEALVALPPQDSALRARLLGRLAMALAFAGEGGRKESLSREAVEMGERVGDPGTHAAVLSMRHIALFEPGNVEQRLATATEILRLAEEAGAARRSPWRPTAGVSTISWSSETLGRSTGKSRPTKRSRAACASRCT